MGANFLGGRENSENFESDHWIISNHDKNHSQAAQASENGHKSQSVRARSENMILWGTSRMFTDRSRNGTHQDFTGMETYICVHRVFNFPGVINPILHV